MWRSGQEACGHWLLLPQSPQLLPCSHACHDDVPLSAVYELDDTASVGSAGAAHATAHGAASFVPGENGAWGLSTAVGLRGEWTEMDSELPYNWSRYVAMSGGQLTSLQLGSTALGRANEADAEKGALGHSNS